MERRRNRPEKYNRETVAKTVEAMKKIDAIRTRRQERYWEARMAAAKSQKQAWVVVVMMVYAIEILYMLMYSMWFLHHGALVVSWCPRCCCCCTK